MARRRGIRLAQAERQALREFITFLRRFIPEQIESVALFGSKARGDSLPDSDIDLLIILTREDRELRRAILREAARLSLRHDVLLSPRVIGLGRWKKMRGFSLYRNVQHESASLEDLIVEQNEISGIA